MNILHVNTYTSGGAGIASVRLHEALLGAGIDSHYLSLSGINDEQKKMYAYASKQDKSFRVKNFIYRALHQVRLLPYGRPYIDSLDTPYDITTHPLYKDADVIHLHWVTKFLDWNSFFKTNKKPIVWTLHDMAPYSGGNHCINDKNINKAFKLLSRQEDIKKRLLQHQNIRPVGPSQWQADNASVSKTMSQFESIHIPNCLNNLHFQHIDFQYKNDIKLKYKFNADDKILFFVGDQLGLERKGFKYLHQALVNIESPLTLMVVGHGFEEQYFKGLSRHTIRNMGPIYEEYKLAELYQIADAVISPSIEDNLPNIMLESFACGTPFIGFPIGGIKEYVISNYNGHLCKQIDAHSLSEGIKEILFTDNSIDYAKNCLNTYQSYFSPKVVSDKYINLYHQILAH
jgi:glycosyltransferase involved in cell wall biosynthesis